MKVTTKKLEAGLYVVVRDGRETAIVIGKGPPPKYRCRQEWCIGTTCGSSTDWRIGDQQSLEGALATVKMIMNA